MRVYGTTCAGCRSVMLRGPGDTALDDGTRIEQAVATAFRLFILGIVLYDVR